MTTYNNDTKIINTDSFPNENLKIEDLYNRKRQLEAGLLVQSNIDKQAQTDLENLNLPENDKKKGRLETIQDALDETNEIIAEAEAQGASLSEV